MDSAEQFQHEIGDLIAEIEESIDAEATPADRESRLQREVFRERADKARQLAARLDDSGQWPLMDGDAERIREALRRSREFFDRNP